MGVLGRKMSYHQCFLENVILLSNKIGLDKNIMTCRLLTPPYENNPKLLNRMQDIEIGQPMDCTTYIGESSV